MTKVLDALLLRGFLETAKQGSIGRAASALGQTQPALSQQLRRLEDITGSTLFIRSRRGVRLTPEGEKLRPYAERILALNIEALEQLSADRARDRVQRKIGIIEDLAVGGRVEGVIANAAESAPNIELSLVADNSQVIEDEFKAGRFDLMLGNQIDEWPGLRARRRGTLKLIWAASPSFDISVRPLPMALCKAPSNWRDRVIERLDAANISWLPAVESSSLLAVQNAASAGVGLTAILPSTRDARLHEIDWQSAGLPQPPEVDVALYRRSETVNGPILDGIEDALWNMLRRV